jgi:hypothetical protein
MMPVALYVTPQYIASVRKGRARDCFGGTVRFIGVDALPFDIEHVCVIDRETPIEALFDAVKDAEMLLNAVCTIPVPALRTCDGSSCHRSGSVARRD